MFVITSTGVRPDLHARLHSFPTRRSSDLTQTDGQGPDLGDQYRSVVFYQSKEQKEIAEKLIQQLNEKGYKVATKLIQASDFYPAENYHQDYYVKTGKQPYCHRYTKRF